MDLSHIDPQARVLKLLLQVIKAIIDQRKCWSWRDCTGEWAQFSTHYVNSVFCTRNRPCQPVPAQGEEHCRLRLLRALDVLQQAALCSSKLHRNSRDGSASHAPLFHTPVPSLAAPISYMISVSVRALRGRNAIEDGALIAWAMPVIIDHPTPHPSALLLMLLALLHSSMVVPAVGFDTPVRFQRLTRRCSSYMQLAAGMSVHQTQWWKQTYYRPAQGQSINNWLSIINELINWKKKILSCDLWKINYILYQ